MGLSDVIQYIRTGQAPERPEYTPDSYIETEADGGKAAARSIEFEDLSTDSDHN
jgi:hypothetical protein